ncbi:MAG TPA: DUF4255 domain-containing protein [Pseudonocardiaceae bacterium]|nr:DUF4255 domain-containing protein [Pseudonocardiaceae bacterium]
MIHEVDEGLRRLLVEGGVGESGVELAFEAPTREWMGKRNNPTVNVFLYDIREDTTRRRTGPAEEYDDDGAVVGWRVPPRWFQLTYLVSAWTSRPLDEHRLLSDVLRCLIRTDVLASHMLTGSLAELGLTVGLDVVGAAGTGGPSASDLWSALDGELRPAVEVRVTAPLRGELTAAGPLVTDGLVVRTTGSVPGSPSDDARRLRYHGATPPQGEGFAAFRPRRDAVDRRRRRAR